MVKVAHPDDVQFVARRATLVADVEDRSCEDVIAELFQVEYAGLVRLAYVVLHDRCSAEDVVMEAFCSLHAHWSGVRRKSTPVAYLRTAVLYGSRSRIRALIRERTRRPPSEVGIPDPSSAGVIARDEAQALAAGVRSLPQRQREVTVCRYYLELSEVETAELLRISVGAVKRHAYRARKALFTTVEVQR